MYTGGPSSCMQYVFYLLYIYFFTLLIGYENKNSKENSLAKERGGLRPLDIYPLSKSVLFHFISWYWDVDIEVLHQLETVARKLSGGRQKIKWRPPEN